MRGQKLRPDQAETIRAKLWIAERIGAIQLLRAITGSDLRRAKTVIDRWESRLRRAYPDRFVIARRPERVWKWASYKGYRVFLYSRSGDCYNVSFCCVGYSFPGPTDWMIDMHNVGQGEYAGKIAVDDPELTIEE